MRFFARSGPGVTFNQDPNAGYDSHFYDASDYGQRPDVRQLFGGMAASALGEVLRQHDRSNRGKNKMRVSNIVSDEDIYQLLELLMSGIEEGSDAIR